MTNLEQLAEQYLDLAYVPTKKGVFEANRVRVLVTEWTGKLPSYTDKSLLVQAILTLCTKRAEQDPDLPLHLRSLFPRMVLSHLQLPHVLEAKQEPPKKAPVEPGHPAVQETISLIYPGLKEQVSYMLKQKRALEGLVQKYPDFDFRHAASALQDELTRIATNDRDLSPEVADFIIEGFAMGYLGSQQAGLAAQGVPR